jgi:hypothetical protein
VGISGFACVNNIPSGRFLYMNKYRAVGLCYFGLR